MTPILVFRGAGGAAAATFAYCRNLHRVSLFRHHQVLFRPGGAAHFGSIFKPGAYCDIDQETRFFRFFREVPAAAMVFAAGDLLSGC